MSDDLEFRIAKLDLGPDDVVIVKVKGRVPESVFARVQSHIDKTFGGTKIRTLIIDASIDISVLQSERAAPQSKEDAA
jgi:hypothetical protein